MGVLDDAIRQHLELKRSHGADEAELQRKENEALGPVRREAEPAPEQGAEQAQPRAEEAPEQVAEEAPVQAPPADEPGAFTDDDPFADDEPFAEAPTPEVGEEPGVVDSTAVEEEPPSSDTPTRGFDALPEDESKDDPSAEPPVPPPAEPPAPAGDPPSRGAGSEDVLEETPEFLQETPEHDRLWFEQKPPRDFDFDDDQK